MTNDETVSDQQRRHPRTVGVLRPPFVIPAFTLVELLVSLAVLALIMVAVISVLISTQNATTRTRAAAEEFREARLAFETITRRLSQATLNTYWDYARDSTGSLQRYTRQSDLHFVCGPATGTGGLLEGTADAAGHALFCQAPLSFADPSSASAPTTLPDLLSGWGSFVALTSDLDQRPAFLRGREPERRRFRLFEFRQPAEALRVHELAAVVKADTPPPSLITQQRSPTALYRWFTSGSFSGAGAGVAENAEPLAENILALVISPRAPGTRIGGVPRTDYAIAPAYLYDSRRFQWDASGSGLAEITRHQLPPVLQVTLVATDEDSWQRFEQRFPHGAKDLRDFINERFRGVGPAEGDIEAGAAEYEKQFHEDIDELADELTRLGLRHRVFTSAVTLRNAKWSTDFGS